MIITITGDLGSGKSTVAKMIAQRLGLQHYSSGDIFRKMAKDKGMDITAFNKSLESSKEADNELDKFVEKLGNEQDDFIIDSRLAWHFIPHSFKVYLSVDETVGARRILKHGRENEKAQDVQEMVQKNKQRRLSELKRYQEYYGLSLADQSQYDVVVDTSDISAEEVAQKVIDAIEASKSL